MFHVEHREPNISATEMFHVERATHVRRSCSTWNKFLIAEIPVLTYREGPPGSSDCAPRVDPDRPRV